VTATRTRLTPEQRREQLLELGLRLFAGGTIDDISIDRLSEEAGVSRGLMYHYFGSKQGFHEAVIRRAVDDLVTQTAPVDSDDPLERLLVSMTAYVDYVIANYEGYRSLVRAAAGGNEAVRAIYEDARFALTDRIFTTGAQGDVISDTPAIRLAVRGWAALAEEAVLAWCEEPAGVTREVLLRLITESLPSLVEIVS